MFVLQSVCALAGDKGKKFCDVNFVILKDGTDKPVRHASVVLHAVDSKGRQLHEGLELKTDGDGKALAPAIPYGKVRVQVIATGMQTYGEDFDLQEPAREITVKLKQPSGQYSIYK